MSDTARVLAPTLPSEETPEQWLAIIFHESLGLIRRVLTERYQLSAEDSVVLEGDLFTWFLRFCQRPESESGTALTAREALLVMACLYARGLQRSRIKAGLLRPEKGLERVLEKEPVEMAREVSRPLRLLYHRLHRV